MNNQRGSACCLASMTLWMQNGYFTRLLKTAQCKCPSRKPSGPSALGARRSIRHTLGDQLRASAQRSVERKGPRKAPPDSRGNPQHLRMTPEVSLLVVRFWEIARLWAGDAEVMRQRIRDAPARESFFLPTSPVPNPTTPRFTCSRHVA